MIKIIYYPYLRMQRICGCKDDTINTKKHLLKQLGANKIADNGKIINIGIIFHINYGNYVVADVEADIVYTIDLLNKDFNKQCSNFDYGRGKYTDPTLAKVYDSYIALADTCNLNFYKVDTKYVKIASQTSSNISVLDRNIKIASPPFEPEKYLNIWIVDFQNQLLGYAQFPWEQSADTDGVVVARGTFGRNPSYEEYNLGKTLSHEIGHWLGLYHTFQETFVYDGGNINYQDGTPTQELQEIKGDCVSDTPAQATPTFGNPFADPSVWPQSKPSDETKNYYHMFMNYMDYVDDLAMFIFTKDQSSKMRQMIHLYRPGILQVDPETPSEPEVPIPTIFTSATYDFESVNPPGWAEPLKLVNNNSGAHAEISTLKPFMGSKSFRSRKTGRAELKVKLSNLDTVTLSFSVLAANPNTSIWIKPPSSTYWYSAKIPQNSTYKQYTFNLPGPFDSIGDNHYIIQFGTNSTSLVQSSMIYSYFDNIVVSNMSKVQKLLKIDTLNNSCQ